MCTDMLCKAYKRTVAAELVPSILTDCQLSITAKHPHFEGLGSTRPSMAACGHLRCVCYAACLKPIPFEVCSIISKIFLY